MNIKYLQNRTDSRITLTAQLFGYQTAKKYPFVEPGKAVPIESEVLEKALSSNVTLSKWLEKEVIKVIDKEAEEHQLIDTLTKKVPEDLAPEQEGAKLETSKGTSDAPKGGKKG